MMAGIENRQTERHSIAQLITAVLVFGSTFRKYPHLQR